MAFTLIELIVLVGAVLVIALVLIPSLKTAKNKARQADCLSNLKQVGLAFRLASGEDPRFLMRCPTNEGGTLEFANDVWRTFQAMSNELNRPGVLICQADNRRPAPAWESLANSNISYFIGLDADETWPEVILSGDHNLAARTPSVNKILSLTSNETVVWTKAMHDGCGNITLSDGSAQFVPQTNLNFWIKRSLATLVESRERLTNQPAVTLRLAMPE